MGAGVRRIWSGLGRKRNPVRIGSGVGIAVVACQLNRGYWAPELVRVFSLEEGDRSISQANVQESKQSCATDQTKVMSQGRGLRDFVPEILDVAVPEASNQGRRLILAVHSHLPRHKESLYQCISS